MGILGVNGFLHLTNTPQTIIDHYFDHVAFLGVKPGLKKTMCSLPPISYVQPRNLMLTLQNCREFSESRFG